MWKKSTLFLISVILQENLYMSVIARVKHRVHLYDADEIGNIVKAGQ